jgi:PAS domain-containing protein
VYDPALDLVMVLQGQKMAVPDLQRLANKLTKQTGQLREANEQLHQREAVQRTLALVARRTDNAVVLTDQNGCTTSVNDGFTRLTKYGLDEVIGKTPGSLLQGPGTDPSTLEYMRKHLS